MKKIIFLFSVLALTVMSCSSDDDGGGSESQDPFIGSWRYSTSFEDGVEVPLDDCESQDTIVISANGTFNTTLHDDFGSGCEVDATVTGTWENLSSGTYSSTSEGYTYVQQVTFTNNTMSITEVDGGITYRDVFVRL
ncbi:lipocalin family protein [Psychroserpens sp. S379A]|uniref:lipocalin family protein n=1 Tax=Psychroserpens sp. S379A TaxID=3415137 RepID=UPI003C7E2B9C